MPWDANVSKNFPSKGLNTDMWNLMKEHSIMFKLISKIQKLNSIFGADASFGRSGFFKRRALPLPLGASLQREREETHVID